MVGVRVRGESSASVRRICTSRYDDIFMCDIRLTGKVRGWSEACWSMVGGEAGWWYTSRGYDVWPGCVSLGVGCGLIVDYSEISTAC
jgi:hypothetical protein